MELDYQQEVFCKWKKATHHPRVGSGSFIVFTEPFLQVIEEVDSFEVLTEDLIIMTVANEEEETPRQWEGKHTLEIWSLSKNEKRLTLKLPSAMRNSTAQIGDNYGPCGTDESNPQLGLYVHDPTADRIIFLYLLSDNVDIGMLMVIYVSEVLKIVASPAHVPSELNWSTWGPRATRWFNYPTSNNLYVYKSMAFIINQDINDLTYGISPILSQYGNQDHTIVLDFNQRSIRREKQRNKIRTDGTNTSNHSVHPSPSSTETSRNTTTHIIEEEWKTSPFPCFEELQSCLPFRIIIGDPLPPSISEGYFVVSDVSTISYVTRIPISVPES